MQRIKRGYRKLIRPVNGDGASTFFVYILRTSKNTLYTGQTNNLERRLKEHRSHGPRSARYIANFPSFELVYTEIYKTRKESMQREYQLKQLARIKKEALINGDKIPVKA